MWSNCLLVRTEKLQEVYGHLKMIDASISHKRTRRRRLPTSRLDYLALLVRTQAQMSPQLQGDVCPP